MAKLGKALRKAAKKAAKLARKAERKLRQETGINNAPGTFKRLAKLPSESRLARTRMRGWNDVVLGRGFRPGYEIWPTQYKKTGRAMQLAYERGRCEAARAKVVAAKAGHVLDEWRMNEHVQGPMYRACGPKLGEAIIEEMRGNVRSVK